MVLPRFLAELKHRKVYRAAVVYAAVGWALLEAADVVLPRLGLPDWTVDVVLAVVLLCFPLAIVFAWIFDLSPQGIVRTEPMSPEARHHFSITSVVEFAVICILVVTVGYLYLDRLSLQKGMLELESAVKEKPEPSQPAVPNPEQYRAIAVLPFADMSEAGDHVWFAEGIAEELLHVLSNVGGLHVKARTSSFAFKNTGKTIAEIAEILGVQAVLEGSVRRSGDRVRVTAQLIDASNGYHIWSGSYERQLTDIFQLQDELARSLVQALRIQLSAGEASVLVAEQTSKPEAYNALIRGRTLLNWGSSENLDQSISYFEKAVSADPDYAKAWGYLAWARSGAVFFRPTSEMSLHTAEAYNRALALNPHQSEALAAKAWMTALLLRDWTAANKLYLQAIASVDNTTAMLAYGMYFLAPIDQLPEALRVLKLVEQRDPLHPTYKATLAYFLLVSGDAHSAIQKAQEALELNPGHFFGLIGLIDAYNAIGNSSAAEAVLKRFPNSLLQHPRVRLRFAFCDVARGDYDSARKIYRDLVDKRIRYGNIMLARLALSLGEIDQAIDHMEWEVQQHSWHSIFIRILFANHDVLKNNPRYLALLKRMGLDDASVAELHRKLSFD
jgi:TolB-like protein/Flp pilus assembly protein TadD